MVPAVDQMRMPRTAGYVPVLGACSGAGAVGRSCVPGIAAWRDDDWCLG